MSRFRTTGRIRAPRAALGVVAGLIGAACLLGVSFAATPVADSGRDSGATCPQVTRRTGPELRIRVLTVRVIAPGSPGVSSVRILRGGRMVRLACGKHARVAARVSLTLSPLPGTGISTTLTRRSTRSSGSTLVVQTTARTHPGTYRLRLSARGQLSGRVRRVSTVVTIVVSPRVAGTGSPPVVDPGSPPLVAPVSPPVVDPGSPPLVAPGFPPVVDPGSPPVVDPGFPPFGIAVEPGRPLIPGSTNALDLRITNDQSTPLRITALAVSVVGVDAPRADAAHPCTVADFVVAQFSGPYGFAIPAATSRTLSALGIPQENWPQLTMVNRPVNQDGCKQATVRLSFNGSSGDGDG